jgi:hypothetical protein
MGDFEVLTLAGRKVLKIIVFKIHKILKPQAVCNDSLDAFVHIFAHQVNQLHTDINTNVHRHTHTYTWHFPGLRCSSMLIDLRLSEQGTSFEQSSLFTMLCDVGSH